MLDVSWIYKFKGLSHLFSLFTSCSALRLPGNSISRLLIRLVSSLGNNFIVSLGNNFIVSLGNNFIVSSLVVCESSVSRSVYSLNEVFCWYVVATAKTIFQILTN